MQSIGSDAKNLMVELENEDPREFKKMVRMEPAMFHELEARLIPRMRRGIPTAGEPLRQV